MTASPAGSSTASSAVSGGARASSSDGSAGVPDAAACPPATSALSDFLAVPPTEANLQTIPLPTSTEASVVTTFASAGIYWSPSGAVAGDTCSVRYRAQGAACWSSAMPLWFDPRNHEYRGSIVALTPGTTYEIALGLEKAGTSTMVQATTWSETLPIKKTIALPAGTSAATYTITEGGDDSGYVLYQGAPGQTTIIDVDNASDYDVHISASKVILDGVVLRGASIDGIYLDGEHDVVIQNCDISGWGRIDADGFGHNLDAAISGDSPDIARLIVQRNTLHNPRSNSNDWSQSRPLDTFESYLSHPVGPQAIVLDNPQGNNVLRYNTIFSDEQHRFDDAIGGNDNFSLKGYPGADSDVYGNYVANSVDDSFEMEGGGKNVRVWGNYMEYANSGISSASVSVGPLYIFRNVMGLTRWKVGDVDTADNRGLFGKIADGPVGNTVWGGGRRYYFHNTLLQPAGAGGNTAPSATLGAGWGLTDRADAMTDTVSRNNIFQVNTAADANFTPLPSASIGASRTGSVGNDLDWDLCNGALMLAETTNERHVLVGSPTFAPGNGPTSGRDGRYALDPSSLGYDRGVRLPNFNDGFSGQAPDMGAQEAGSPAMEFGVNAYLGK